MPAPRPLTLCPPARLDFSRPGTPAATDFDDIYFSTDGGLNETRQVFLDGCGLPEAWAIGGRHVIGELGFGTGLNFLAAWQMWEAVQPDHGHLFFVSCEKYPLDRNQLALALGAFPHLSPLSDQLIKQWPGRVRGIHSLHFDGVSLILIHDDVAAGLDDLDFKANSWFLDGFSPAKNPNMWTPEIMQRVADHTAPGGRLATFTVAGSVRRALEHAGFDVMRKPGFGRKRHRLEARFPGQRQLFDYRDQPTPTIIGTGIAGSSLARACHRRGITPHIISQDHDKAASSNPAALVKPRLDLQDRPESRFFLSSYLFVTHAYQPAKIRRGITHFPKSDAEETRNIKLGEQSPLPQEHLYEFESGRLMFPEALVIDPVRLCRSWQPNNPAPSGQGPTFMAAGYGVKALISELEFRYSRGQLSWAKDMIDDAVSYGGYATSVDTDHMIIGATHDRIAPKSDPYELRPEDDAKNLQGFTKHLGIKTQLTNRSSRASIRVTTPDTLPAIGRVNDDRFILSGLGSRGFTHAPLLGEALIAEWCGDPMPIARSVRARFDCARLTKT